MQAKQLVEKDAPDAIWWMCSKCQALWSSEGSAARCCEAQTCVECKKTVLTGGARCEACLEGDRVALDESMFAAARKIPYFEYDEPFLFWAAAGPTGRFFGSRKEIEKYCTQKNLTPPRWVWACEPVGFLLDVQQVLQVARDRTCNEINHLIDDDEVERLQKLLDDWAMAQNLKSWDVDYDTAVVLDPSLYQEPKSAPAVVAEDE